MQNYYEKGSYNVICDVCGRKFKANQVKKRWDGFIVCPEDYETRHPQDLIRVRERVDILPYTRDEAGDTFVPFYHDARCDIAICNLAICDGGIPACPPTGGWANPDIAIAGCAIAGNFLETSL